MTALPARADATVAPLAADGISVSADQALNAASAEFHLRDGQIDANVGVVRALISIKGDVLHQREKVWIVPVNFDWPMPGTGLIFHKLLVVINGRTGRYEYAYTAAPDQAQLSVLKRKYMLQGHGKHG